MRKALSLSKTLPQFSISRVPCAIFSAKPIISRSYADHAEKLTEPVVTERIVNVIKQYEKVKPDAVTPKAHFIQDLGLDSLDSVELGLAIEEEFGIEIPDDDADKLQSVPDAVAYILTNKHAK
eukprot:TRINITY_DN830_c0_g1_i1.p2 TRINITY_DN830_c0_g1~~TRINITY_DN830_c0_g1_i1.p2  ORF type:complete len:123 (+),score=17.72 TRINITY_DN830_c0_g1_i1:73-441(+)